MNKIQFAVGISLVIFFVTVTGLMGTGLWAMKFQRNLSVNKNPPNQAEKKILTEEDVAMHKTLEDCWIIISGKVYAVSSYLGTHPGGALVIVPYCGKDATQAFATKDRTPTVSHSEDAQKLLQDYLIGTIGEVMTQIAPSVGPTVAEGQLTPTIAENKKTANFGSQISLTTSEVASHNTLQNCWMIISNNVYNITSYVYQHPGGSSILSSYCGQEATAAFQSQGGRGSHSNNASNILNNFLIGTLNSSVVVNPTNTPGPGGANPTATPISSGGSLPMTITNMYPGATKKSGGYEDNGSWEGKINTSSGQCREIKVNSSGNITENQGC